MKITEVVMTTFKTNCASLETVFLICFMFPPHLHFEINTTISAIYDQNVESCVSQNDSGNSSQKHVR